MKLRDKVIHGAKWTVIAQYTNQLLGLVVFVILARLLGPEEFGLIAMATALIAFMGPFVGSGLGAAIIQRAEVEEAHLNTAFWANLVFGTSLTVLFISTSELWANVFSAPQLADVLCWLSLSFIFSAMVSVQEAILKRNLRFKSLSIRSLVSGLVGGVVGVVLALNGFGVWSLVARMLVSRATGFLLLWAVIDWRPSCQFSGKHFKELYSFGVNMLGAALLVKVNRRSDSLIIGYFLGPAALGFYNVAYRLMNVIFTLVSKTTTQVAMPAFARVQKNPDRLKSAFYEATQLIALIAVPVFLGIIMLVPELVRVLLGSKWVASIPVLQVLVLVGIAHCLLQPVVSAIVGVGRPGLRLKVQAVDAVANLIGFLIAVHWGIVAVAVSYVTVGYLMIPIWYLAIKSVIPMRVLEYLGVIVGPFVATLIMVLAISAERLMFIGVFSDAAFLVLAATTGALIYVLAIYFMYPAITKKVFDIVKTMVSK